MKSLGKISLSFTRLKMKRLQINKGLTSKEYVRNLDGELLYLVTITIAIEFVKIIIQFNSVRRK